MQLPSGRGIPGAISLTLSGWEKYEELKDSVKNSRRVIGHTASPDGNADKEEQWDVFISHASEDKKDVVEPLAEELRSRGLKVWYDKWVMKIGDRLLKKIDHGLSKSRYGIVILSPSFLKKEWPKNELDGLVQKEIDGNKVILPVWHNISRSDLVSDSPVLAGRLAGSNEIWR